MAVKTFGKGRGVYISGLPYSFKNSRVLYRAVLWSASAEEELHCWYSTNYNVEVHAYVKKWKILCRQQHLRTTGYSSLHTEVMEAVSGYIWRQMRSKWYQI